MTAVAIFVEVIMSMKNEYYGRETERIRMLEDEGKKLRVQLLPRALRTSTIS